MTIRFRGLLVGALFAAWSAGAQPRATLPAGSPLGGDPAAVVASQAEAAARARRVAQARAEAGARDAFQAAFAAPEVSPVEPDPGRQRATGDPFGQTESAPTRPAPSPYGGYYRITTPWAPR